ncbi:MAG TPA: acid phosphatase [Verrucomicrobia bacterium]|nr:acid phosphatase [Verrucomicrobiota bacterium]HCG20806.1 acid phosphatase [Verrucomicrobiota bacterium]
MMAVIAHYDFWNLFTGVWFWSGCGGWIVASIAKMIIAARKTHTFDFVYLVSTGGMPSSHSATVSGLAFSIGYTEGFASPLTTLAVAFALLTMFDAATVRRAAGEHARILNAILRDIQNFKLKPVARLRELLGHTRMEVFWGMVTGIAWATLLNFCWPG